MAKGKVQDPPSAEKSDQAAEEASKEAGKQIEAGAVTDDGPEQSQQAEDGADAAAGSQAEPDEQSEGFVTGELRVVYVDFDGGGGI